MKIAIIIAPILFFLSLDKPSEARLSTIFEPKEKETGKYKALCSNGGQFDGCSVFVKNNKLFTSGDSILELKKIWWAS